MTTAQDTFKKCSPWMRLSICINIHVTKALINVLHNHINEPLVNGLPSDPADLYAFLQTNKKTIKKSTFIKKHQESILLPAIGQSVDSSTFDVSLTRCLIQTFCRIRNAKGNWTKPDATDHTICANVYRAADMRNSICHDNNIEEMKATEFEKKWKQLKEILQGLKYFEDIEPFKAEKLNIAKYEDVILEEFDDYLRSYKEECKKEKSQDDYILRRFAVDGNEYNIVTESDFERLLQDNDCLVIHGEAGMGKSSTAKRLKNEWCANKVFDNKNIIYYDSKRMNKQLTYKSNAAALAFSEMRDHLTEKRGTIEVDDLSIFYCVKTTFHNLIIVIDGIDEFPVKERVTRDYVDKLERKVLKNEEISGTEAISAIYFGHLFPYSKLILLGRNGEFESLKKVKVKGKAAINNRTTKNLELLKFDVANIKEFTCLKICKQPSQQSTCTGPCQEIHRKIKNIELCKNPTDLNSMIELQNNKHLNEVIGNITRTKLLIAIIFNRLTNHIKHQNNYTVKTFLEIGIQNDFSKYFQCIRTLGEISFKSLLKNNVTVRVEKEIDGIYFEDENKNKIRIERETLEELDLFYVRDLDYYFKLEPHHTINIEFLSACYLFSHPDEWDSILELNEDRKLVIIKFIAGLHADDYFTKDFVKNVLNISSYSLERFLNWLYNVGNVRWSLPDGGRGYDSWFGLMETQKLSPSFYLLDSISQEVEIPQTFIPNTIVCYSFFSPYFERYDMEYLKHNILTKRSDKLNIELFLKKFPSFKFIVKGNIWITDNDKFNRLNQCGANNLITFKINELYIWTPLDTSFSSHFNVNSLYIRWCDSRTIDMMLNALLPPPTKTSSSNIQPTLKCKQLVILYITDFNSQQTEKLFEFCLCGVVDSIRLDSSTFFTDEQLAILKDVERGTNTQVNIELYGVNFNCMFDLPNLGNRHVNLNYVRNATDNDLIELRNHIPPGYCDNFNDYRIISSNVPFVRRDNYCKQSMFLNLNGVNFLGVSPEVFANTFSIIPSLSCEDHGHILSSHWLRLSQIEDCRINEMRIWKPQSENFKYFVNIKTRVSQFICNSKDDLKQLLNYIVNNQDIELLNKELKVFVVKVDDNNWDYYEEIMIISGKTVEEYRYDYSSDDLLLDNICVSYHEGENDLKWWCCEIKKYKDNYSSDNSRLDNIRVPFHEGEQHLKRWCCEISQPSQEKTELCVTNTHHHSESSIEETKDEGPIVKKFKIN